MKSDKLTDQQIHHRCLELMGWTHMFDAGNGLYGHLPDEQCGEDFPCPPIDHNFAAEMRKMLTEEERREFVIRLGRGIGRFSYDHFGPNGVFIFINSDPLTQCRIILEIVEGRAGK